MKHMKVFALGAITALMSFGSAWAEDSTVRVAQVPALTWAAWMGLPESVTTAEGDKVTFETSGFRSSGDVLLAVQTGQIDIGPTAFNVVASAYATTNSLPLRMVAGLGDGTTAVVLRKGSEVKTLEDMRDKRVGLVRGSNEYFKFQIALASAGLNLHRDLELTTLSSPTDQILALQRGDLDAIVTYAPFSTMAVNAGGVLAEDINKVLVREAGVPTVIIANTEFLERDPKGAQAAIDAYVANWRAYEADKDLWVDTYLKTASGDRDLMIEAVKNMPIQWEMKDKAMIRIAHNLAEFKVIPADTGAALTQLIDYGFLEKATGLGAEQLGKGVE
ncbi:MAG: ABC transporter substrate-binding protein [Paracoccus sp. (in: a-proteobacteria)]|uniref:ABC transporter substrate-binding protein n=1 Tax=Paracoccus sp. TaxID=267 RepID=UPI0039E48394